MDKDTPQDLMLQAKSRGVRLASARSQVIAVIDNMGKPFSASELLEAVEKEAPSVGRATVFRTLQLLCDLALVERVRLDDGQDVYVTGHSHVHHHHLICTGCEDIREINTCDVDDYARNIAKHHGFIAEDHTFDIYGLCPTCQSN